MDCSVVKHIICGLFSLLFLPEKNPLYSEWKAQTKMGREGKSLP